MPRRRSLMYFHSALIAASMVGFLQWGNQQNAFVAQVFWDFLCHPKKLGIGIFHPLIGLPILGIIGLLVCIFWKSSPKWLTYVSIAAILPLYLLIFIGGVLAFHPLSILSSLPVLGISALIIWRLRNAQDAVV